MSSPIKLNLPKNNEQRRQLLLNSLLAIIALATFVLVVVYLSANNLGLSSGQPAGGINKFPLGPLSTATPAPITTPTPKPLTFAEMNAFYGPCVQLPTLMYHHIQTKEAAVANKQTSLTVNTDIFSGQMQYLKDRNYNIVSMNDLVNFFENDTPIPKRSVLLTFDDGYQDFSTDAFPVLANLGFRATVFVPTGLINNPGYLTWDEINRLNGSILFANHTWSHKSVLTEKSAMEKEISLADTQLSDHGINGPKVFAYPYGPDNIAAETYLESMQYKAAFTTKPGNILCKKQRYNLPRIRIGNSPLSGYGF
jgi:peptidoglycan/xylan/chitin deacetylase (PgdA/CDA1 family)